MVREAEKRLDKYKRKVDAEVLKTQTIALKPSMVSGQLQYFPEIASLEEKIKRLVEAKGVKTLQVRDYLNYGRELLNLSKRFSGTTLQAEAQLKLNKWQDRGLDGIILLEEAQLLGLSLEGYESINCLFDMMRIGAYYLPLPIVSALSSSYTVSTNWLYSCMYPLSRKARFDKIGYYNTVSAGAGNLIRLGIYDSNSNRYPRNLLLETTDISIAIAGWKEQDIDITLSKGLYYLAIHSNNISTNIQSCVYFLRILGAPTSGADKTGGLAGYFKTSPYGNMPSVFPSSASELGNLIRIGLRVKELL